MEKRHREPTRVRGVRNVIAFNWPIFALTSAIAFAALLAALVFHSALCAFVGFVAAAGLVHVLVITYWVYDASELYALDRWLPPLAGTPKRILVVHTGLDEVSTRLTSVFPEATVTVCDIHDERYATAPSIARARKLGSNGVAAKADAIPLPSASADLVIGFLALHEIRDSDARAKMFAELGSIGARLVIVEHTRDTANFVAYGPGAFHFLPRTTWTSLAGFTLVDERTITPFVRVFTHEAA